MAEEGKAEKIVCYIGAKGYTAAEAAEEAKKKGANPGLAAFVKGRKGNAAGTTQGGPGEGEDAAP